MVWIDVRDWSGSKTLLCWTPLRGMLRLAVQLLGRMKLLSSADNSAVALATLGQWNQRSENNKIIVSGRIMILNKYYFWIPLWLYRFGSSSVDFYDFFSYSCDGNEEALSSCNKSKIDGEELALSCSPNDPLSALAIDCHDKSREADLKVRLSNINFSTILVYLHLHNHDMYRIWVQTCWSS